MRRIPPSLAPLLAFAAACGEATAPSGSLRFVERQLDLDTLAVGTVQVANVGPVPAANIRVELARLKMAAHELTASVTPSQVSGLAPRETATLAVAVTPTADAPDGEYLGWLRVATGERDSIPVRMRLLGPRITILQPDSTVRQGDALALTATVTRNGAALGWDPLWSVLSPQNGFVEPGGAFVGYADSAAVVAQGPRGAADTVRFFVVPRGVAGSLALDPLGHGPVDDRLTSDLWVFRRDGRAYAYTGTWGDRNAPGNTVYAWDVTDPAAPVLADSVTLDARTVNDVKVSADGRWAVATHEGSHPNGITLLDLADPAHPDTIRRYTAGLESGVHNTWIEAIGGRLYVFACRNGDAVSGLRILDVTDPANPIAAAQYGAGESIAHDVYVRDGLAFVSHWDAGLAILDVGAGIAGGGPARPREVARLVLPEGNVHNAWWWPEGGVAFVGHELAGSPYSLQSDGLISVIDVADLAAPRRVATFRITGAGPHNFWVDESAGVLYSAYYNAGLLAIDVTGRLLGALDLQGRLIARARPGGSDTFVWAPQQVAPDLVWLSDMRSGLWSVRIGPPGPQGRLTP